MIINRLLYFVIFTLIAHYAFSYNKSIEIEFIAEYFQVYIPERQNLIAFLCWNKADKYNLLKRLNSQQIRVAIFDMKYQNIQDNFLAQNMLYYLDVDCNLSIEFLKAVNNKTMFAAPHKWLLSSETDEVLKDVNERYHTFNILADSDVIIVHKFDLNQFHLTEIYRINKKQYIFQYSQVTTWVRGQGFTTVKPRILSKNRKNLNGTVLRAGIVILHNDTLNHLHDYRFKHMDTLPKANYIFTNHLMDMVNGSKDLFFLNTWGYKFKNNNSFTGMIGTLQRDEAEIGGSALFITSERVPFIEYTSLTTPTSASFVFRQPPLSYVSNVFALPFTRTVWISSILLVALTTILLYSTVLWEWHQPALEETENAMDKSFLDAVMLTIAAVAQQGATSEPRSAAGKIVMIFTFISLMFLYVSYSANIVALLQSSATNIRTLEDLLKSRLTLGVDGIVYNRYYFEIETEPIRKAIYEQKVAPPGQKPRYMTLEAGVAKMREGFFAFHMELGPGYTLISDTFLESEKCGLQEIPYLFFVHPHLAIKKNSSYKEIFKVGARKIHESGIQSREIQKLYTKKPKCHTGGANFVSVGLIDVYAAFLVLVIGLGISVIMFLLETLLFTRVHYCRLRRLTCPNVD